MAAERDDEVADLLGRALDRGLDGPVDTGRLVAGAHRGARRIRRRRAGVAVAAVLAVAGVPVGQELLAPRERPVDVAGTPAEEESPPPVALTVPEPDPTPETSADARPAPSAAPEPVERSGGRVVVPDDAMLDLESARGVLAEARAGTLGSWTADSDPARGSGWPERVPCSDGPDAGEVAETQGLRELGSDDGRGVTLYTTVAVYPPESADEAWQGIAASIEDGTCEGGLISRPLAVGEVAAGDVEVGGGHVVAGTSADGTIALALARRDRVVVSVRLYSSGGPDVGQDAVSLVEHGAERLRASGFLASLEAEGGG